jgi:hypothetical protein
VGHLSLKWGQKKEPNNVTIKSPTDELRELNDKITEKLKKWTIFDIDVPKRRLSQFIEVIEQRNLVWHDPGLEHKGVVTLVIGKIGSDFKEHEEER